MHSNEAHLLSDQSAATGSSTPSQRAASLSLALADRLFGGAEPVAGPSRRWLLRYLGVAALLAAIIVARRPDAVTTPQFWAEDGYVFFYENLTLGFPHALAKMYLGFPYLAHRLIAFAGGLVPFAVAPRVYTTSAIAITAVGLASFALPGFRHLVRSDGLRVLFGVIALAAPFRQEEIVLATPTNLGWFVAVWLSLLSLMRLPRQRCGVGALAFLGGVAVLSTPLAVINVPLWLLRGWRGVRRREAGEVAFSLVLLGATGSIMAVTRSLGADTRWDFTQGTMAYLGRYLGFALDRTVTLVQPDAWPSGLWAAGTGPMLSMSAIVVAVLLAASAAARFRTLPALAVTLYLFAGSLFACAMGRATLLYVAPYQVSARYSVYPAAMFALAVVIALDGVPAGRPRRALGAAVATLLVWSWAPLFVVGRLIDQHWSRYAARLERKLATRSRMPLVIPANPPYVPLEFDLANRLPEVDVPPETIVGSLGTHGMFRQSFLSRCDNLLTIEMRLGAVAASGEGALTFSLLEGFNGRVVATTTIPRKEMDLDGDWQPFQFEPIKDSAGKRYTIVLRAVENALDASLLVLGSRDDWYPDGEAVFVGQVSGDASFRYGCQEPPKASPAYR